MKCVSIAFALLAFGIGLRAAWLWRAASMVQATPLWAELGAMEPVEPYQSQGHWISGLLKASTESSDLNRQAALWTAWAVALGAVGNIAGLWPIWSCFSN